VVATVSASTTAASSSTATAAAAAAGRGCGGFARDLEIEAALAGEQVWELREAWASFSVGPELEFEQDSPSHDTDLDGNRQASDSGSMGANTRHLQASAGALNPSVDEVPSIPSS
jgi:hypothetical protein